MLHISLQFQNWMISQRTMSQHNKNQDFGEAEHAQSPLFLNFWVVTPMVNLSYPCMCLVAALLVTVADDLENGTNNSFRYCLLSRANSPFPDVLQLLNHFWYQIITHSVFLKMSDPGNFIQLRSDLIHISISLWSSDSPCQSRHFLISPFGSLHFLWHVVITGSHNYNVPGSLQWPPIHQNVIWTLHHVLIGVHFLRQFFDTTVGDKQWERVV